MPNSNLGIISQRMHLILLTYHCRGAVSSSDLGCITTFNLTSLSYYPEPHCYLSSSIITRYILQFQIQMKEDEQATSRDEDNDIKMPLNPQNKFLSMMVRSKSIDSRGYKSTVICLVLGAIVFLSVAIAMFVDMGGVVTYTLPYYTGGDGSPCSRDSNECQIEFTVEEAMSSPVYVSYQLDDYFQNQRIFIQSKNNQQLSGQAIDQYQAEVCHPFVTNAEIGATHSWGGQQLDPNAVASPCGSIAHALFNDTFQLQTAAGANIAISENGITWPGDAGGAFKRGPNSSQTQWIDPQNQRFINWMRTSGLINFKKLWGIVNQNIAIGQYNLKVRNNYLLDGWNGGKYVVLSTVGIFGGKNYTLPIVLTIFAVICCSTAVFILLRVKYLNKISNFNQ